jgi:hypothetical protein
MGCKNVPTGDKKLTGIFDSVLSGIGQKRTGSTNTWHRQRVHSVFFGGGGSLEGVT